MTNISKFSSSTASVKINAQVNRVKNAVSNKYSNINSTFQEPTSIRNNSRVKRMSILKVLPDFNSNVKLDAYKMLLYDTMNGLSTKREKVTNLAIFLGCFFPKLPYVRDFTSGHDGTDLTGLDWTLTTVERGDGTTALRSLDCSGLVSWCFQNAGIEVPGYGLTTDYETLAGSINKSPLKGCDLEYFRPGDFAYTEKDGGHIGVIVDVDKTAHVLTIVHTSYSGGGVNITKINTDSGKIVYDDTGTTNADRIGIEDYFDTVLHINYDDE